MDTLKEIITVLLSQLLYLITGIAFLALVICIYQYVLPYIVYILSGIGVLFGIYLFFFLRAYDKAAKRNIEEWHKEMKGTEFEYAEPFYLY